MSNPKLILGHNPITGGRHLGQYFGSMIDLKKHEDQYECYVILDDWMDILNYPLEKEKVLERSLLVVQEFINAGIDPSKVCFGLSSLFSTELSEVLMFLLDYINYEYIDERYLNTFFGHFLIGDRLSLGLPASISQLEKIYNLFAPVAYTFGLNADAFLGGKDVEGYIDHIEHLLSNIKERTNFEPVETKFLSSEFPFVVNSEGEFMTQSNALFISDSVENIEDYFEKSSDKFVDSIGYILGSFDPKVKPPFDRETIKNSLIDHLRGFQNSQNSNAELLAILVKGSRKIAEEIKSNTKVFRKAIGFPKDVWEDEIKIISSKYT